MERHVNTYECEWEAAIETPELRKRFSHLVNAPVVKDPSVQFDKMMAQVKAKDW